MHFDRGFGFKRLKLLGKNPENKNSVLKHA
jgi:hypothetical protein